MIVVEPTLNAVSKPVVELMVAFVVSLLVQVPPDVACVIAAVKPLHTPDGPLIAPPIDAFTLTCTTAMQLLVPVYVMLLVPPDTPVISPVSESTVTTAGLPDAHVPPVGVAVSVVELPSHSSNVPEITGMAFIVITAVL